MTEKSNDIYGSISISPQPPDGPSKPAKAAKPGKKEKESAKKAPRKPRRQQQEQQPRQPKRQVSERQGGRGNKKLFFWFGILVFVFGLYSAAGYLLVPYLVQNKLPDYLAEKTGVYLTTGRISFNPYNFKLVAREISGEAIVD